MADWWWTVQQDDHTYPFGTDDFIRWDPATVSVTSGAPSGPSLDADTIRVFLPSGFVIEELTVLTEWTPWVVPWDGGLQITDLAGNVLVDHTFTFTMAGFAGYYDEIYAYTMPEDGYVRAVLNNGSPDTDVTTYSGNPSLIFQLGWSSPPAAGGWRVGRIGFGS